VRWDYWSIRRTVVSPSGELGEEMKNSDSFPEIVALKSNRRSSF